MFSRTCTVRTASALPVTRTASSAIPSLVHRKTMASGVPSESAKIQQQANASSASFASHGIRNTNINAASGVDLSDQQKVLVGSILDV